MKKIIFFGLLWVLMKPAFAQTTSFPPYANFSGLENLVSVQFNGLVSKNRTHVLSRADLQDLVKVVNRVEEICNTEWASIYIGYVKRAEARILFSAASVISNQPDFYSNRELMKSALDYIDRGFVYLGQYDPRVYPPSVEVNVEYVHDGNGRTTGTTAKKMSVQVDEGQAVLLRSQINEVMGNKAQALDDYFSKVNGSYSLAPYDEKDLETSFIIATRILEISKQLKKYDQRFVNFCVWALDAYEMDKEVLKKNHSTAWMNHWIKLEPQLFQALDDAAAEKSVSRYTIIFRDDQDRSKSTGYDWMIPVMNKFDSNDKLVTFQDKKRSDDAVGNRVVFNLTHYCISIVEGSASPELIAAANAMLQKHFGEMVTLAKTWYSDADQYNCGGIKWIADRMDKYPADEKDKNMVLKKMKKCNKIMKW